MTQPQKPPQDHRPPRPQYYMGLAVAVSVRAECKGLKVGAVLVLGNRVVSTGYNGAPEGWDNCSQGKVCPRCDNREAFGSGNGYDKCICVHAEMNAIAAAARYGIAIDGSEIYVTHQPCFTCAKELIQAGVRRVYYAISLPIEDRENREMDEELKKTQSRLMGQLQAIRVPGQSVGECLVEAVERFRAGSAPPAASRGEAA